MNSWIVVTNLDTADMMALAVQDAASQEGLPHPPRVLVVSNGSSQETRRKLEVVYGRLGIDKVLPWWFEPALPSLSGCWNRALDFCWQLGAEEVLVTQADARLNKHTYEALRQAALMTGGLFVSAVGRRAHEVDLAAPLEKVDLGQRGGPDFSCFVVRREGHAKIPFDENYTPAYGEDCCAHREYILKGLGDQIFSVNVPYIHHGAGTLNLMTPERRAAVEAAIDAGSRAYHERAWGGPINQETQISKFKQGHGEDVPQWILDRYDRGEDVSNPALFDLVRSRW